MSDTTEFQTIEVVYIGRRIGNYKLGEAYIPLADLLKLKPEDWDDLDRDQSCFAVSRRSGNAHPGIVGGIFTMECKLRDDGHIQSARTAAKKFVCMLDDREWLTALCGRDESNYIKFKAIANLKKLAGKSYLEANLESLRAAYKACAYRERAGFELAVLNYLRSGK